MGIILLFGVCVCVYDKARAEELLQDYETRRDRESFDGETTITRLYCTAISFTAFETSAR